MKIINLGSLAYMRAAGGPPVPAASWSLLFDDHDDNLIPEDLDPSHWHDLGTGDTQRKPPIITSEALTEEAGEAWFRAHWHHGVYCWGQWEDGFTAIIRIVGNNSDHW